jgi:hypothetical protein
MLAYSGSSDDKVDPKQTKAKLKEIVDNWFL